MFSSHTIPMKVFVDARMMGAETSRGIGRVIEVILPRLIRLRPEVEWVVLVRYPEQWNFFAGLSSVRVIERPIAWYGLREQLEVPWLIFREGPDQVLFFHWNIPLLILAPFVCFIHDLLLLHHPLSAKISLRSPIVAWVKRIVQRVVLWSAVRRAKGIAVPTNYVAADMARMFPREQGRVFVVGEGVDEGKETIAECAHASPYCLVVGSAYPHKRLDLVLEAWKVLAGIYPNHVLVFVGERDVFMRAYAARVQWEKIPRVEFMGRVSDTELWDWMTNAELLVFPSDEEGFGLPPLEALMHGCPVLASDASCLPEVLPNKGVRFFRHGEQAAIIEQWDAALRQRECLLSEILDAQAWIRAHHSWDASARAMERLLFVS